MAYHLLTGATGLIGRYLLYRLTTAGLPIAVVARGAKLHTAADRVEAIMRHWETIAQRSLLRPVILEGELTEAGLGLSTPQRDWVARHCDTIVHSAAAMIFRTDERGEPHRTNVGGMENLLQLCRELGIRKFHHVSTAYVCGLREGRVREDELDLGQSLGNVYEQSKLQAEKTLREAAWLDQITVYRPASVIGDSQNGYTSSFHGFYLPLQLAYAFAGAVPPEEMNDRFIKRLGLQGDEGKNFVPVDWVSAAIAHLVTHSQHHGRTYHLASPKPVSARLFQAVVQEAIRRYCKRPIAKRVKPEEMAIYEKLFHDQLQIYRSHWRDDPVFDRSNAEQALSELSCPEMDFDLLMRVARWPVENNFSTGKFEPIVRNGNVGEMLAPWLDAANGRASLDQAEPIALQVTGSGGGQWRLWTRDGELFGAECGLSSNGMPGCYLNSETLAMLADGRTSVEQSIRNGRLLIEGPRDAIPRLVGVLKKMVTNGASA